VYICKYMGIRHYLPLFWLKYRLTQFLEKLKEDDRVCFAFSDLSKCMHPKMKTTINENASENANANTWCIAHSQSHTQQQNYYSLIDDSKGGNLKSFWQGAWRCSRSPRNVTMIVHAFLPAFQHPKSFSWFQCRRTLGVSRRQMETCLRMWIRLSSNQEVPGALLFLTRPMFFLAQCEDPKFPPPENWFKIEKRTERENLAEVKQDNNQPELKKLDMFFIKFNHFNWTMVICLCSRNSNEPSFSKAKEKGEEVGLLILRRGRKRKRERITVLV